MAFRFRIAQILNTSGLNDRLPTSLKSKIILTNWVTAVFFLLVLTYTWIFYFMGYPTASVYLIPGLVSYGLWIYLNTHGHYDLARMGILATFNSIIFVFYFLFPGTTIENFCLVSAVAPMIFFTPSEPKKIAMGTLLGLVNYYTLLFFDPGIPALISPDEVPTLKLIISAAVFFTLVALVTIFHKSNTQVQKRLQLQASNLKDLETTANIGTWRFNFVTNELRWSDQTYRIHEVPVGEPQDVAKAINYYHPDAQPIIGAAVQECIEKDIPWNLELQIITRTGKTRWVHAIGCKDGDFVHGTFQDVDQKIKDRKDLEEQRAKAHTSARLAALGEMAGGMAHEINNPLAVINGAAYRLQVSTERGDLKSEDITMISEKINKMVRRITGIIRGLKNLSRDTSEDPCEPTPMTSVLDDVLELSTERLKNLDIEVSVNNQAADASLLCRPVEVCQVMVNLLNNSVDAIKEMEDRDHKIEVQTSLQEEFVSITISDTGPGIPEEIREKVFQPFFTTKEVGSGTGLGLSLSRSLIEKMGGKFQLVSPKGPYKTSFEITLPLARGEKSVA